MLINAAMKSSVRLIAIIGLLVAHPALAKQPPAGYAALGERKAMATVPGAPERHGISYARSNDLAAATDALTKCQTAWSTPCEIVWLNQEAVTPGAEIHARARAEDHPLFLWRYTSDSAIVYLAGSIHLLKPSLYPLPIQLQDAFNAADYLVLEVDTASLDPQVMQQLTARYGLLPNETTLSDVLPPGLYKRLGARLANYGVNVSALARFKPSLVMTELVRLRLAALGYLPEYGVEQYFRSRLKHQSVLQLETIELQMRLLFDQPMNTQVQLLADTLDQEMMIEPLLRDMLIAWLSGDDAEFLALFEAQSGDSPLARSFTRQLLDERNVGMSNKIQSYLAGQGTYFVLAGAAHFVGDNGIVRLLESRGLRGTRINSASELVAPMAVGF